MISYFQAIILGALQGATELFPISSLGHSILLPYVLGWQVGQGSNYFLIFIVATHLATSLVLFGFFFSDWKKIFIGIFRSLKNRRIEETDTYAKIGWLLVLATIPAGILGLLFEEKIKLLFGSPRLVALFLLLNGIMLFGAEILRKKSKHSLEHSDTEIAHLSWGQSFKIGTAQALALIPGFSRTGATLGGGLMAGLSHRDAARFSFLLATPIIFAASVLKLPELIGKENYAVGPILVGSMVSALAAYISVKYLTRYFKSNTLKSFAIYCVVVGLSLSILFTL